MVTMAFHSSVGVRPHHLIVDSPARASDVTVAPRERDVADYSQTTSVLIGRKLTRPQSSKCSKTSTPTTCDSQKLAHHGHLLSRMLGQRCKDDSLIAAEELLPPV